MLWSALMLEDRLLIWRLKCGSREALCTIYERHRDDLLRLAASLLNDRSSAEDLVHEIFVAFSRNAAGFHLSGSLRGYLATCVANRARNLNRDGHRHQAASLEGVEPAAPAAARPDRWIELTEQFRRVSAALAELPSEQREVVTLHIYGRMTFREVARSQGLAIKTVQSRYRYALDKLRTLLDREVQA
jgi:RNA polymerase sigma factor (sigma-70 family)